MLAIATSLILAKSILFAAMYINKSIANCLIDENKIEKKKHENETNKQHTHTHTRSVLHVDILNIETVDIPNNSSSAHPHYSIHQQLQNHAT